MSEDPYAALGVGRDASQEEIKRRYRQLAKELHPDLNPDRPDAADRFGKVSAAYDLLSDPEQRGRYDRGEIDAAGQERPRQRSYRDFAEDPDATRFYTREGFADQEEMQGFFEDLFGSSGGAGRRGFRMQARGLDVSYALPIDFLEAAKGARKRVVVDGRTLDIAVPAGVRDRQTLRLKGQGMPGVEGAPAGDALVEIHIQPHAFFERRDNDVHMELPVTLAEAVLGSRVQVPTIDGPVSMTIPRGSNTGSVLRLRARGIVDARSGQRGDQYLRLKVVLPKEADPQLEAFLQSWKPARPYDPRRELEGQP